MKRAVALMTLRQAAHSLETKLPGDPHAALLACAIRELLDGEAESLDEALYLAPRPGELSVSTLARLDARNTALREAAATYFADLSTSQQASRLATELARYAASSWPRDCSHETMPDRLRGRLQGYCWQALKAHARVIGERQIRNILECTNWK